MSLQRVQPSEFVAIMEDVFGRVKDVTELMIAETILTKPTAVCLYSSITLVVAETECK